MTPVAAVWASLDLDRGNHLFCTHPVLLPSNTDAILRSELSKVSARSHPATDPLANFARILQAEP